MEGAYQRASAIRRYIDGESLERIGRDLGVPPDDVYGWYAEAVRAGGGMPAPRRPAEPVRPHDRRPFHRVGPNPKQRRIAQARPRCSRDGCNHGGSFHGRARGRCLVNGCQCPDWSSPPTG